MEVKETVCNNIYVFELIYTLVSYSFGFFVNFPCWYKFSFIEPDLADALEIFLESFQPDILVLWLPFQLNLEKHLIPVLIPCHDKLVTAYLRISGNNLIRLPGMYEHSAHPDGVTAPSHDFGEPWSSATALAGLDNKRRKITCPESN